MGTPLSLRRPTKETPEPGDILSGTFDKAFDYRGPLRQAPPDKYHRLDPEASYTCTLIEIRGDTMTLRAPHGMTFSHPVRADWEEERRTLRWVEPG